MRSIKKLDTLAAAVLLAVLITPVALAQYVPPTAHYYRGEAILLLERTLPTGHVRTDREIAQAAQKLEVGQNPNLWVDENHLDVEHGDKLYKAEQKALERLDAVLADPAAPSRAKDRIEDAFAILRISNRMLADLHVDDAVTALAAADCDFGDPADCDCAAAQAAEAAAREEFRLVGEALRAGDVREALNAYHRAWAVGTEGQLAVASCLVLPISCPCDGSPLFRPFTDGTADVTLCLHEDYGNEAIAENVIYTGAGAEAAFVIGDDADCNYHTAGPRGYFNRIRVTVDEARHCIAGLVATAADCLAGN